MQPIKKIKAYKADILLFSLLSVLFIAISLVFTGHQGSAIIDCGREAYIPSAILKGKVLFKDILILYGPFSYQLNAFFYKLFGENLNTLYAAGILNAYLIMSVIYLTARIITSKSVSFCTTFLIMTALIFHFFITSFTFPYAFAIVYALSAFLVSVLFFIQYLKSSNPKFVPLSYLFIGISLLAKIEYILFLGILMLITLIIKPVSRKYAVYSFGAFIFPTLVSYGILFFQGLNIGEFIKYLDFMHRYSTSNLVQYFYKNYTGFFPSMKLAVMNFHSFTSGTVNFFTSILVIYPLLMLALNKLSSLIRIKFPKMVQYLLFLPLIIFFPFIYIRGIASDIGFSWLPVSTTVIFIVLFVEQILKIREIKENKMLCRIRLWFEKLEFTDKTLMLLSLIAFTVMVKSYFFVTLQVFGTFILPLAVLVNLVFLIDYLPKKLKFLDKQVWKITCLLIFLFTGLFYSIRYAYIATTQNSYPVESSKGRIYTNKEVAITINTTLDYVQKNVNENASILVIPEGAMINFLSGRQSDDWYYSLIPNYLETFGESSVINDLSKNSPDYIFIDTRDCADYGFPLFGQDYGFKLFSYIKQNYSFEKEFGNTFKIYVYKKTWH